MHLMAGIGKNISLAEGIAAIAVFQAYAALEDKDKFDVLMVVDGIFLNIRDSNMDWKVVLICNFFK